MLPSLRKARQSQSSINEHKAYESHLRDRSLRSARSLPPFLPVFDTGLPLPRRGKMLSPVHFRGRSCTYMGTQLSRSLRSVTARLCRSTFVPFGGTISSERVALRALHSVVSGCCIAVRIMACLACDRARLMRLQSCRQSREASV